MYEDLSEGEKGDVVVEPSLHGESNRGQLSSSDTVEAWTSQQKGKKLYIVLISLHGLIRGEDMELGRDSDTGGQVKYVVELARALGSMSCVHRVDLLTRQVSSPEVDRSYGEPTEMLHPRNSESKTGESSGAYIVRIPFGPKDKYVAKELLWPHIPEFVDVALGHIIHMSKALGDQIGNGNPIWPSAVHGHYADAGDSAALLSGALNVPMLFTGHSLGRDKLEQLLRQGGFSQDEIDSAYKITRRIEAEEFSLDASEVVVTSTRQEIEEQWRLYDGFDPVLERELRGGIERDVGCYGRFMPRMIVISPGMEFHHLVPRDGELDTEREEFNEDSESPDPPIWTEIMRFFSNPMKPMILALARPDPKKNLTTLVKAFGECKQLRELANLTLIMGNRDNIDEMSGTNASVLLSILKMIDTYDLYGLVAYPKHHKQSDVPNIYRLAAKSKGVFINPAFIEPFGLTLIEAAAHGLPIVATKNGGPVDIHRVLENGILVDPHDRQSIADALLKLVADEHLWENCRENGLKNIHLFSWPEHCKAYLSELASCKPRQPRWLRNEEDDDDDIDDDDDDDDENSESDLQDTSLNLKFSFDGENKNERIEKDGEFPSLRRRKIMFVIAVDCEKSAGLSETIKKVFAAVGKERAEGSVGFVLATSFIVSEIRLFLGSEKLSPNDFDAFICNSGGDLYYSSHDSEDDPFVVDLFYHSHIEYRWGGEGLRKALVRWAASITDKEEHVVVEDEETSADYCYSFKVQKTHVVLPLVKEMRKVMRIQALRCRVVYCQNGDKINVIPVMASRAQALRYLYLQWGVDLSKTVVVIGESGDTDYEELLGGAHKTVVLSGVCTAASNLLRSNRSYPLTDVVCFEGSNIFMTSNEQCSSTELRTLLEEHGAFEGRRK